MVKFIDNQVCKNLELSHQIKNQSRAVEDTLKNQVFPQIKDTVLEIKRLDKQLVFCRQHMNEAKTSQDKCSQSLRFFEELCTRAKSGARVNFESPSRFLKETVDSLVNQMNNLNNDIDAILKLLTFEPVMLKKQSGFELLSESVEDLVVFLKVLCQRSEEIFESVKLLKERFLGISKDGWQQEENTTVNQRLSEILTRLKPSTT